MGLLTAVKPLALRGRYDFKADKAVLSITDFEVEKEYRNHGYGTVLMQLVIGVASSCKFGKIAIELDQIQRDNLGKKLPRYSFLNYLKTFGFMPDRLSLYFDEQGTVLNGWELSKSKLFVAKKSLEVQKSKVEIAGSKEIGEAAKKYFSRHK